MVVLVGSRQWEAVADPILAVTWPVVLGFAPAVPLLEKGECSECDAVAAAGASDDVPTVAAFSVCSGCRVGLGPSRLIAGSSSIRFRIASMPQSAMACTRKMEVKLVASRRRPDQNVNIFR